MSTADRTTAALPIDVVRLVDATTTQEQITGGTYLGGDDRETLRSFIEDAENEFKQRTGTAYRIGREGLSGARETYDTVTVSLDKRQSYKQSWMGVSAQYDLQEPEAHLNNERVLPFDPDEGDEAYIYRGMSGSAASPGDAWDDVTDQYGNAFYIVDHRKGVVFFEEGEVLRSLSRTAQGLSTGSGRRDEIRLAITYRYGSLGGSRQGATTTTLTQQIDDTETGTVSVADGSLVPSGGSSGPVTFRVGEEYVLADPDPAGDAIAILERGVRGTTASAHSDGARLNYTPPAIRKAIAARAGMSVLSSGRYQAWAPDTDESFQLDDVRGQLEETYMNTVEAMS